MPVPLRFYDAVENGIEDVVAAVGVPDDKWCHNARIEVAVGKTHRVRISEAVSDSAVPCVRLDEEWALASGFIPYQQVHIVSVTTGQRDVMNVEFAPAGSRECKMCLGSVDPYQDNKVARAGYNAGDVIIVMSYAYFRYQEVKANAIPPINISFPFEQPIDTQESSLADTWDVAVKVLWDGKILAQGLVDRFRMLSGGKSPKVLDCSCGAGFPGIEMVELGVDVTMTDGSSVMVEQAKKRAAEVLGEAKASTLTIRQATWDQLPKLFGAEAFDIVIWRGNSLPYIVGSWTHPSMNSNVCSRKAALGYHNLAASAKGVYAVLKPGGQLYIDCIQETAEEGAIVHKQGTFPGTGEDVKIEWQFTVDGANHTRNWKSKTVVGGPDGRVIESETTGLLVREREVRSLLQYAGFGLVERTNVNGENAYQGLVAQKSANPQGYYDRQIGRYKRVWNGNGKICWGLFQGLSPVEPDSKLEKLSLETGDGALVGPNLALFEYMTSKYPPGSDTILDVGCGPGRSCIDIAKKFPNARVTGVDPGNENIVAGKALAEAEGVADRCKFICGLVEDTTKGDLDTTQYSAVWSEAALCHAMPHQRIVALHAIAEKMQTGGVFVLNDAIAGPSLVSPATQLHTMERLSYKGIWNARQYTEFLEHCGLHVVEFVDLTAHQAKSYAALAEGARKAADASATEEERQVYDGLYRDYTVSSAAAANGEVGWALFVCRKAGIVVDHN